MKAKNKFNLKAIRISKWYIKTQERMSKKEIIKALVNEQNFRFIDVKKWIDNNYNTITNNLK
tara:strand:- start:1080 stop:1265 length:186 start_codon:yes stop_codon:yes gene_type:complete